MDLGLSLVMMALGAYRFAVTSESYQSSARTSAWRWAKKDRLGRAPALEYLGPDTDELMFEGVIYPHFRGGLGQVDLMRAEAGLGVPSMMVDGTGLVWNRWCIAGVEERRSFFMTDGAPRKIEFTLTLQSYGEDLL